MLPRTSTSGKLLAAIWRTATKLPLKDQEVQYATCILPPLLASASAGVLACTLSQSELVCGICSLRAVTDQPGCL